MQKTGSVEARVSACELRWEVLSLCVEARLGLHATRESTISG